eukprot:2089588-Rhodomonas_salina.1
MWLYAMLSLIGETYPDTAQASPRTGLRTCYAVSGTDLGVSAYAMTCYAVSGTDVLLLAYGSGTSFAVLTSCYWPTEVLRSVRY